MAEFFITLALVIIPVIIGGIFTYGLSHSWQTYRYKTTIKKQLIEAFHNYVQIAHHDHEIFVRSIFEEYYSSNENLDDLLKTGLIQHSIRVDPTKLPIKVTKEKQYNEFLKTLADASEKRTYLSSLLRLYTDSDELISELDLISRYTGYVFATIKKMMKTTNPYDFDQLHQSQFQKHNEVNELIIKFEKTLANVKIRKIPV